MYRGETDDDYTSVYGGGNISGYDDDYTSAYGSGNLGADLTSVVSVVGGLFSKSKDPGRLATNAEAYKLAISGNPPYKSQPSALEFLRVMSTSWATTVAKKDAAAKYAQASQIISKQGGTYAAPSSPIGTPTPISMGGPVVAGLSSGPLMIAGAAALGIYFLTRKGRR